MATAAAVGPAATAARLAAAGVRAPPVTADAAIVLLVLLLLTLLYVHYRLFGAGSLAAAAAAAAPQPLGADDAVGVPPGTDLCSFLAEEDLAAASAAGAADTFRAVTAAMADEDVAVAGPALQRLGELLAGQLGISGLCDASGAV